MDQTLLASATPRIAADLLLVALAVFTTGSLACGLTSSMFGLIAARVLQGLCGGVLMVLSQALIGELVSPAERRRYQCYFALVLRRPPACSCCRLRRCPSASRRRCAAWVSAP